jgi:hypothetical protein
LPYTILFENKPEATAPAHEVRITDQLDLSKYDLSTFELGPVFWGSDKVLVPPPGQQEWTDTLDLRPGLPLILRVDAKLNVDTGLLTWHFQGLNPDTGELETAPEIGFLPPDKTPPQGQGGVTFTVSPKRGMKTGDKISNKASIVFDRNEAIETPTWTNTIDGTAPTSRIASARVSRGTCRDLTVTFAGSDRGAGIAHRSVSVSKNGAPYRVWLSGEKSKKGKYRALADGAYAFRSIATDGVGYAETSSGAWDGIVTKVRKRGSNLTLTFSKRGVKAAGIRSLRVTVDGKRKANLRRVGSSVTLKGVKNGGHTIGLDATARVGGRNTTLKDSRVVAMCPKYKAPRKKKR